MKNSINRFIQSTFIFAFLLFNGSCQTSNISFELKEGWKIVEKDKFSFEIPASFKEKEIQGEENLAWEFEDSSILLMADLGVYTGISEHIKNSPDYVEKWTNINGQPARLISFRRASRKDKSTEIKQIMALFFEKPNYSNSNLILEAEYESESDKNIISTIFNSVKIK